MRRQSNTNHRLKKQPRQHKNAQNKPVNNPEAVQGSQDLETQKDFLIEEVGVKQNASEENIHDDELNMIQYKDIDDDGNFTNP